MTTLDIALLRTDGGTQSRALIDKQIVADYAEAIAAGDQFPAVVVFYDGSDYWLADGFHRYEAYAASNQAEIPADIRQGTQRDAILWSVGANAAHGLRRTNDDKRRAVLTLLNDQEWAKWSDREIARRCAVDGKTVAALRPKLSAELPQIERTVCRNGKTYEQNTAKIGKGIKTDQLVETQERLDPALERKEPARESKAPVDPERRKLAQLTTDALIDEVIGLRADLADEKAKVKAQESEIRRLKEQLQLFQGDQAEVIRRQAKIIAHKESEMYRANDKADKALAKAYKLEQRVRELERMEIEL